MFMTLKKQVNEQTDVQKLEGKPRGYLTKAVLKVYIGPIFCNITINQRDSLEILCVYFHSSCFPASLFQSFGKKGGKKISECNIPVPLEKLGFAKPSLLLN